MHISHLPEAVLWDMDGTLIDSEPISIAQQFALVEEHGGAWSMEQSLALVGTDMHQTADALRAAGVALPMEELVATLEGGVLRALQERVVWRPGALHLLADLRLHGVRNAIVTTSSHDKADLIAESLPTDTISEVIGAEDVTHSKPHPDPYRLAARRLDVDIQRCIAIEDSPNGLRSAVSSGAICIAVPNNAPIPTRGPWTVWTTLENRTAADLADLMSSPSSPDLPQHGTGI